MDVFEFLTISLSLFCLIFIIPSDAKSIENIKDEMLNRDKFTMCTKMCDNRGVCNSDGICECVEGFSGEWCNCKQTRECFPHFQEQAFCSSQDINFKFEHCDYYCLYATEMEAGTTELSQEVTTNSFKSLAQTTEVFKVCPSLPPNSENAYLVQNSYGSQIEFDVHCLPGYVFPDRSVTQNLMCLDGQWYHQESGKNKAPNCQSITKFILNTYTNSEKNDLNEQSAINEVCPGQPPIIKNAIQTLSSNDPKEYKVQCLTGYQFPDSSQSKELVCKNSVWSPKNTYLSEIPDCEEIKCPEGQSFYEKFDGCRTFCGGLLKVTNCKSYPTSGCRCPPGQYLNIDDKCVHLKDCHCLYEDDTSTAIVPGAKYLELCTCQNGFGNCTMASELDEEKYESDLDMEYLCFDLSCEIFKNPPITYETTTASTFQKIDKHQESIVDLLKYALALRSEKQLKLDSKETEIVSDIQENRDIPGVKITTLNLQLVEIQGRQAEKRMLKHS